MIRYHKYKIKETDRFDVIDFPKVEAELEEMVKIIAAVPAIYKEQMIISYLEDHSLENEWIETNPELAGLLKEEHFNASHTKALFESCMENKNFRLDLEGFIKEVLAEKILLTV